MIARPGGAVVARLVLASLRERPGRSALLLAGYALGVGVTLTLLSIGGALLEQSRDRELVGGGDLLVLPAGLDLETLKTGGASSLYFTLEQAPFLYRQVLEGPRFADRIEAAAPWIEDELLYLRHEGRTVPISGSGHIPSRAAALGVPPRLVAGRWDDAAADRAWTAPGDSALYAELDGWHLPTGAAIGDSTWAEWHYFNVVLPDDAGWLYLTYMISGEVPEGRWGGRLLATLVGPAGPDGVRSERVFEAEWPPARVRFREGSPAVRIGPAEVAIDGTGTYRVAARVPARAGGEPLRVDLRLRSSARRYLPPLDVSDGSFVSGYVVPLLDARAMGEVCVGRDCRTVTEAPAYHDHNWGTWRATTWDWGQARAGPWAVLYGGVTRSDAASSRGVTRPDAPSARTSVEGGSRFLFLADSLGFAGVYPIREIEVEWEGAGDAPTSATAPRPAVERAGSRPARLRIRARRGADSVRLDVRVAHVRSTDVGAGAGRTAIRAVFHQMRGTLEMSGRLDGTPVRVAGEGFFETWGRPAEERAP